MSRARRGGALEGRNLRKEFGGRVILDGVSFEWPAPGLVALFGGNGSGKSTFLNIISGFVKADAGEVLWRGRCLTGLPPSHIASLGVAYLFQRAPVIKKFTSMENLLLALLPQRFPARTVLSGWSAWRREAREVARAEAILERFGLRFLRDMAAGDLSFGQRRALSTACALAHQREVVLLDEPLGGLHTGLRNQVMEILREEKEDRLLVVVDHDIESVGRIADQVAVLDSGRLSDAGSGDGTWAALRQRLGPRGILLE